MPSYFILFDASTHTILTQFDSTEIKNSLLRKKNISKKTPTEDDELGYSDFIVSITIH